MKTQWTKEQAWAWYNSYPWLRGCNFIGSDCANRRDQWQSYRAEEHLATADRELELAQQIGFNTVRLIMDFDVWLQERESYMDMLEKYIALCAKYGQYVMLVLTAEAELPRGDYASFVPKPLGEQKYALGYHQGRDPEYIRLTMVDKDTIYHPLESPRLREKYLEMVREIVMRYRKDCRVICWNVYNELGIVLGERAIPILSTMLETVRACDPVQPLTADIFRGTQDGAPRTPEEKYALETSDVVSFHSYSDFPDFCIQVNDLKRYGRPLLCTEWLNRITHNDIREVYPFLWTEHIGSWCWGFVAGKTQTYEPWLALWNQYEASGGKTDCDFTKWQHDLFRPSLYPYDPKEITLIRRIHAAAEKETK